jgi:hypothetical protein
MNSTPTEQDHKQSKEQLSLLQTITMEVAAANDFSSALEVVLRRVCEKTELFWIAVRYGFAVTAS